MKNALSYVSYGLFSFILLICCNCCEAQSAKTKTPTSSKTKLKKKSLEAKTKLISNEIKYVTSGNRQTITFMNGKVWDVAANNPYNKLKFPVKKTTGGGSKGYKISGMVAPKRLSDGRTIDTFFIASKYLRGDNLNVTYAQSSHEVGFLNKHCSAICYSIMALNEYDEVIGHRGNIIIFDSLGNKIWELKNLEAASGGLALTEDGRYLGFTTGGPYDEGDEGFIKETFQVYDVAQRKRIVNIEAPEAGSFTGVGPIGNKTLNCAFQPFRIIKPGGLLRYYYIFGEGKLYSKTYDFRNNMVIEISDAQFKYKNLKTNEIIVEYFERDFERIPFN